MSEIVIVGGGLAGLAAGVELSAQGFTVRVLEARPHLGGRAYSFVDAATGETVDNGQHAMMGCYHRTLAFFARLGVLDKLHHQSRLRVAMIDPRRGAGLIAATNLPNPLHMLGGIFGYELLDRAERWQALFAGARLMWMHRRGDERLRAWTVEELLLHLGQSANSRESFWYPVAIATLNELPQRACAAPFAEVLARAFFGTKDDSRFVLPKVGLSELYTTAARDFIERHGGRVETKAAVTGLRLTDATCTAVELRDGRVLPSSACILAVPPRAAHPLLPGSHAWADLDTTPIVSVHFWLDRPVLREDFTGLLGTSTHWLFNRTSLTGAPKPTASSGQSVSAVISAAHALVDVDNDRIVDLVMADIRSCLPAAKAAGITRAGAIKEKHATISVTPRAEQQRPQQRTAYSNLFLAGDWVRTGLPATIESAVLSGYQAASHAAEVVVAQRRQAH